MKIVEYFSCFGKEERIPEICDETRISGPVPSLSKKFHYVPFPKQQKDGEMVKDKIAEQAEIPSEWLVEFEAAARRPLEARLHYAFIRTYKPVLDDAPYRAFDTMEEYRRWCENNLPDWLGYGRV
jgi:hypothetical protein